MSFGSKADILLLSSSAHRIGSSSTSHTNGSLIRGSVGSPRGRQPPADLALALVKRVSGFLRRNNYSSATWGRIASGFVASSLRVHSKESRPARVSHTGVGSVLEYVFGFRSTWSRSDPQP